MCDIELELPSIEIQKKYVEIYKAMLENQSNYEKGLDDLKIVFQASLENNKQHSTKVKAGRILKEIDERNYEELDNVKGININKQFMPTVADISNSSLKNHKIVRKNNFAFSGMQTGRDKCIRIALQDNEQPVVITSAYSYRGIPC
jgi:type I restriction enzyme S subunit